MIRFAFSFIFTIICCCSVCSAQKVAKNDALLITQYPAYNPEKGTRSVTKEQVTDMLKKNTGEAGVRYMIVLSEQVDELPTQAKDKSFLKSLLDQEKWKMLDWGAGNFDKGPRFVNMEFYKNGKYCFMFRKYTYKDKTADGNYPMLLTEEFEFLDKKSK